MTTTEIWIGFNNKDREQAEALADARLGDSARRLSPDRLTARNRAAQLRCAYGEIGAAKWLRDQGFQVETGFVDDHVHKCDLSVAGVGCEVMTAQIAHRQITGFCVPPNKLGAARHRGAWGYIFVGTGSETPPLRVCIQGAVVLGKVNADPPRLTRVSAHSVPVLNHVIRPTDLLSPLDASAALVTLQAGGRK
jgi:hypothetical protein